MTVRHGWPKQLQPAPPMGDKPNMDTTAKAPKDAHGLSRQATTLSVVVAIVLIAVKAFALGASGSVSILASLADSALDLLGSLGAFFAVRWAAAPPDDDHRHGHGKAEALSSLVQAGLVFASAVFISWEAISRIFEPRAVTGGAWGVAAVVISIAVSLWLVRVQTRAIRASGSLAVTGDRAHYVADIGAGLVVLIGVVSGAYLNAPALDAAAGLIVAIWLFWGAAGILRASADQLLDRSVDDATRARIVALTLADPRVLGIHQLRTRMSGSVLMIQMHLDLEPTLTLMAAHDIVVEAEQRLLVALPQADILIHPDPRGHTRPHGGVHGEDMTPETTEPGNATIGAGPWSR
jgi:ferrous-iron efflux pump FieF